MVGIGPGKFEGMTHEAARVLEASDVIVGYTVYVDLVKAHFPNKTFLTTPMRREVERVELALQEAAQGKTVAMVCSGDPGVYGMSGLCEELAGRYPGVEVVTVPGVSAVLSGAAILGAPLMHDFAVISLSDLAWRVHPWAYFAVSAFLCWQCFAARCLMTEAKKVVTCLETQGLAAGRRQVAMLVGRDTENLTEEQVVKAAVETVAENTSDGVVAPFLWMALFGAAGGLFYKAINTMDSMEHRGGRAPAGSGGQGRR